MTMKKVNIFEIKAKMSEYIDLVENGEQIVICRRNQPVAELRAVAVKRRSERPVGGTRLELPESFFEPLPRDVEDAFYGVPGARGRASSAAERADASYGAERRTKRRKKS
jgi:antitoxin (DNA-binding transcriptional repressor) of toxin-antitoxin stability system